MRKLSLFCHHWVAASLFSLGLAGIGLMNLAMETTCMAEELWPQWRGGSQNGVAAGEHFPTQWSETSGVDWKVKLPGLGGSTPVIVGSSAFLTYGSAEHNHLAALDLNTGETRWSVALGADRGGKHRKGSGSNPSPVTDGKHVYAYYRSGDLACVDLQGNVKWQLNLQDKFGEDTLWWDLGTSPLLTEQAVVVAVMQSGPSYLVAFDKTSGDKLWQSDRALDAPEESAQSYTTPLNVTVDGKPMIAVMGADHLTLHTRDNGKQVGVLGGFNPDAEKYFRSISSPVAAGEIIVCPYARGATLTGVNMRLLAEGKEATVWFRDDIGSDVPTPAALGNNVYVVGDGKSDRGQISCLDIQTGKTKWQVQLPKSRHGFTSSPLVAGNHLYVTQEDAVTFVIGPLDAEEPSLVATNELDDNTPFTVASPVPVGDSLLIRTREHLYRVSAAKAK
ncbi:outer membrane biogenesis protein BamB [Novipirellula galeiformis]|uniref:Outer membrane biogenesis protein BamB n=1 Tax=Novipirellula galeiformis TaxID=2528004 RepID=A0A5C6CPK2_9BACT|nr:PQQ-binding-like beta-propeller repeat protein [Novipirellula galeiformis]TWU26913.1 outer membrane biogenesis protein BamB [Novipirellula galeiformis]